MAPGQHPYPGFFSSDRGLRAFTGRLHNGQSYPILINAQEGSTYPAMGRTSRCSSPTTPPAERRAYAAREQARKAKAQSSSERSASLPPQARHTHSHRVHPKREPELGHPQHAQKHSIKHHHHHNRKEPKPSEPPRRGDSDDESNWSTDVHAPQTPHHPHHYHHHRAAHLDHYTFKAPLNCHCHQCLHAALQPIETPKEDPTRTKYFYEHNPHFFKTHSVPVEPGVPCSCGHVHVEPAREHMSRSSSPEKHRKGHRKHSPEPEEIRSHRCQHRRHCRHRHQTNDSSSDTTNDDDDETSLESDEETRTESGRGDYELPNDWHFCNECCWGHPVIYILR